MGVTVTLRYVKELGAGRYEYRRRVPESVKATLGKSEWKRVFTARGATELAREHARVDAAFMADVTAAGRSGPRGRAGLSPRDAALQALKEAEAMIAGVVGLDDDDDARREVVAESLEQIGADPLLYQAVIKPNAKLPKHTLQDARELYLKEKLGGGDSARQREARLRLEKVIARAGEAGMPPTTALVNLNRERAKAVRDHMLSTGKKGGGKIKPESVQRDIAMLKAVISYAIKEFELDRKARNPFDELTIEGTERKEAPIADWEKKNSLPASVNLAMVSKLQGDPLQIWRLLDGTGCRLAEITGLRVEDVVIEGHLPHIKVRWHGVRRLKNLSSIRSVPLVGDALEAAQEALQRADGSIYLFPRYARVRGPDAASAILMKHLRTITQEPKHTVHSLRHTMKGRLQRAGVEKTAQDLILGHMTPGEGERYGGEEDRLAVALAGMLKEAKGA